MGNLPFPWISKEGTKTSLGAGLFTTLREEDREDPHIL